MKTDNYFFVMAVTLFIAFLGCDKEESKTPKTEISQASLMNDLFQKAIDLEPLNQYLHPEIEGREVLCILGDSLPKNLQLNKFGNPVKIVTSADECENYIEFYRIEIKPNKAKLSYHYVLVGVGFETEFELNDGSWSLINWDIFRT